MIDQPVQRTTAWRIRLAALLVASRIALPRQGAEHVTTSCSVPLATLRQSDANFTDDIPLGLATDKNQSFVIGVERRGRSSSSTLYVGQC